MGGGGRVVRIRLHGESTERGHSSKKTDSEKGNEHQ